MLYRFKSKAAGDVVMNGPVGDRMLRLLGREPSAQGIVEAAALPAAIAALERAIADEGRPAAAETGAGRDDRDEPRIGLAQRAYPLLQLMRRAAAEGADVVWGV